MGFITRGSHNLGTYASKSGLNPFTVYLNKGPLGEIMNIVGF